MQKPSAPLTAHPASSPGLLSGPCSGRLVQGFGPAHPWHHQGRCAKEDAVGSGEPKEEGLGKGELCWGGGELGAHRALISLP